MVMSFPCLKVFIGLPFLIVCNQIAYLGIQNYPTIWLSQPFLLNECNVYPTQKLRISTFIGGEGAWSSILHIGWAIKEGLMFDLDTPCTRLEVLLLNEQLHQKRHSSNPYCNIRLSPQNLCKLPLNLIAFHFIMLFSIISSRYWLPLSSCNFMRPAREVTLNSVRGLAQAGLTFADRCLCSLAYVPYLLSFGVLSLSKWAWSSSSPRVVLEVEWDYMQRRTSYLL